MNVVILDLHPFKIINGSLFYAFEYCSMLNSLDCESKLVIHTTDDTNIDIITNTFCERYKCDFENGVFVFDNFNVSVFFFTKKVDILKLSYKSNNILFVDIYSYNNFKDIPKEKHVFSNEYYEPQFKTLTKKCQDSTIFYGYYDYQYHTENCDTSLKINFDIFRDIERLNNNDYIHLTDPIINNYEMGNVIDILQLSDPLIKLPSTHIKNLFSNINCLYYYQNSDVIDKNNRSLLEAQYYGIDIFYYDSILTLTSINNIKRLKSRIYTDFTLSQTDKLINNIINLNKSCNT